MQYRADIDGLRAIAVLAIVLFHAELGGLNGGFVGVDVFFVISGFLIGSIVVREVSAGTFSFAAFFERRIRRLVPALVVMLLATFTLGLIYSMPSELKNLSRAILSTVLLSSNLYFWRTSGYFDAPQHEQPLLHMWSLAIEEQFYLFAPATLVFLARYLPRHINMAVLGVTLLSFLLCVMTTPIYTVASFFLLPARAWELLLGVCLALGLFPRMENGLARNAAAASGAAMIVTAILCYTENTSFPGVAALLPSLGAALVIGAGASGPTLVGKFLSLRPLVFVGLISYSLYLWHWPILVFQQSDSYLISDASPVTASLVALALSFALAILSWRYVERPFRNPAYSSRPRVMRMAAMSGAALASIALGTLTLGGLPSRFPPEARMFASMLEYDPRNLDRPGNCMIAEGVLNSDFDPDCLKRSATKRNYLLIGDSHAEHLWYGLNQSLPDVNVMEVTGAGCRPLVTPVATEWDECRHALDRVFKRPEDLADVDKLLIAARWAPGDETGVAQTLDWANQHGIDVVLFGPIVQYQRAVPRILAMSVYLGKPELLEQQRLASLAELDRRLERIATERGVTYVSLQRLMCERPACMAYDDNIEPLQYDYGHLTVRGSLIVANMLKQRGDLDIRRVSTHSFDNAVVDRRTGIQPISLHSSGKTPPG